MAICWNSHVETPFMEFVVYTIVVLIGTPALTAFFAFLLKERIKSFFLVGAQKDINTHKQELDTYTESMKHSLQREMSKVEHSTRSKFSVYPKAYARLIKAHGKIAGLYGLRHSIKRNNSTSEDVRYALESRNVLKGEIERIVAAYEASPTTGLEELEKMLREVEVSDAHNCFVRAKNYLLLNELFMSPSIINETSIVLKSLNELRATALTAHAAKGHGSEWVQKFFEQQKLMPPLLEKLRDEMRNELHPKDHPKEK